jgi:hypothetical protein
MESDLGIIDYICDGYLANEMPIFRKAIRLYVVATRYVDLEERLRM